VVIGERLSDYTLRCIYSNETIKRITGTLFTKNASDFDVDAFSSKHSHTVGLRFKQYILVYISRKTKSVYKKGVIKTKHRMRRRTP
jgi:hypothetical protein